MTLRIVPETKFSYPEIDFSMPGINLDLFLPTTPIYFTQHLSNFLISYIRISLLSIQSQGPGILFPISSCLSSTYLNTIFPQVPSPNLIDLSQSRQLYLHCKVSKTCLKGYPGARKPIRSLWHYKLKWINWIYSPSNYVIILTSIFPSKASSIQSTNAQT